MNIEGFVYRLSHHCQLDIKREVSTAFCRSSSGNSVILLSTTICTNMVVSDRCITSLAQGCWFCSIQRIIVGIIRGGKFKLFLQQSSVVAIAFSLQTS